MLLWDDLGHMAASSLRKTPGLLGHRCSARAESAIHGHESELIGDVLLFGLLPMCVPNAL
jgi:hypothetical protein